MHIKTTRAATHNMKCYPAFPTRGGGDTRRVDMLDAIWHEPRTLDEHSIHRKLCTQVWQKGFPVSYIAWQMHLQCLAMVKLLFELRSLQQLSRSACIWSHGCCCLCCPLSLFHLPRHALLFALFSIDWWYPWYFIFFYLVSLLERLLSA